MRCLKLKLAYVGTAYAGWQRQPERLTVQSVLENALAQVTGERVKTVAAGRTDAGVHALGQIVTCTTHSHLSSDELCRAINACLPPDVCVLDVQEVPPGFHPIRDSIAKRYRYLIQTGSLRDVFAAGRVWHCWYQLDCSRMRHAAQYLLGRHDFRSFQSGGSPRRSTVRELTCLEIESSPALAGQRISIEIEADGFLYNMVRNIVGTLVEVGRGKLDPEQIPAILQARDRRRAGPTAPAHGLYLVAVRFRESPIVPQRYGNSSGP